VHRRIAHSLVMISFVLLTSLPTGCAEKPKFQENKAADHLRKIATAFTMGPYAGGIPKNAAELKALLKQLSPKEDPDELLRSPNDGEPYEIMWGANFDRQTDINAIFAHEKKGVDGKRFVINVARIVSQMTDAEFAGANVAHGKR
jgi:hypothetical protein